MKELILTIDYELFGDGSGDIFNHLIEPTNQILNLCNNFDIKITIFFEVIEYLKLKEEWSKGNKMGYKTNPIEAIEKQIQYAALNQHDIQLHIHPQWINAKHINGNWEVDFNNWRLGDFKIKGDYSIFSILRDGKKALENIIKQVLPEYTCIGLRAGGYNIMPSTEVYSAMKELGLKFDSSIYPGGYENGNLSKFDYRNVPSYLDFWWTAKHDMRLESQDKKEVVEIPIFSLPIRRWKKNINISKVKSIFTKQNIAISSVSKEKLNNKNLIDKLIFMVEKEVYTWDFCMFTKSLHKNIFNYIEKKYTDSRNTFVLIGHPKNLLSENQFRIFLKIIYKRKQVYTFKTLKEKYEEIDNLISRPVS
jgi:hypothetical protein